jgi:hypothetical protein
MNVAGIIAELDAEISRLKQARNILSGGGHLPIKVRPKKRKKRKLSPEGRARIVAALKKRWAKRKRSAT